MDLYHWFGTATDCCRVKWRRKRSVRKLCEIRANNSNNKIVCIRSIWFPDANSVCVFMHFYKNCNPFSWIVHEIHITNQPTHSHTHLVTAESRISFSLQCFVCALLFFLLFILLCGVCMFFFHDFFFNFYFMRACFIYSIGLAVSITTYSSIAI